jgi:phospholipid-binding lipoprotein MlaA
MASIAARCTEPLVCAIFGLAVTGCGTLAPALRADTDTPPAAVAAAGVEVSGPAAPASALEPTDQSPAAAPEAIPAALAEPAAAPVQRPAGEGEDDAAEEAVLAQAKGGTDQARSGDLDEQYDPWEPFNEKTFEFNYRLDRYVLKPAARVYRAVMPEPFQLLIANGFDNIRWVPRFVNSLLQGKLSGAGRELARFLINSTAGIGGLFDPAKDYWGIRPSKEDFGQTLGVWGAGPGPYLVLPFLEPMTVRDGIGRGVDTFLDPLGYVLPFFWDRLGMKAGDTLNERALNYDLFQGVEETTIDLYSSVRHFYLKRREQQIRE